MPSKKLSALEISQLVHYGARMTSRRNKDGSYTDEAEVMHDAMSLGFDINKGYIIIRNLDKYMKERNPLSFIQSILKDIGLIERCDTFNELTIISGICRERLGRGGMHRISDVPIQR